MNLKHDGQVSFTYFKDIYGQDVKGHRVCSLSRLYESLQHPKVVGHDEANKTLNGVIVSGKVEGNRKDENVIDKNIIIIDVDDLPKRFNFFQFVANHFKYAFAIYSTYKHTSEYGRYRLLIPINRDLTPAQYRTLATQIVKGMRLQGVDTGSFDVSRAFALPVVKDSESDYVFAYQDQPIMEITDNHIEQLNDMVSKTQLKAYEQPVSSEEWREVLQPMTAGQGRNVALSKLVGSMLRRYVDVDVAFYLATLWNKNHYDPLSDDEFNTTFKSIYKKEMQRRAESELSVDE